MGGGLFGPSQADTCRAKTRELILALVSPEISWGPFTPVIGLEPGLTNIHKEYTEMVSATTMLRYGDNGSSKPFLSLGRPALTDRYLLGSVA